MTKDLMAENTVSHDSQVDPRSELARWRLRRYVTIESLRLFARVLGPLFLSTLVLVMAAIFVIAVMLSSLDSPQALSEGGVASAVYYAALLGFCIGAVRILFSSSSTLVGHTRRASLARELVEQAISKEKNGESVEWILMPHGLNAAIETALGRFESPFAKTGISDVRHEDLEDRLLRDSVLDGAALRAALDMEASRG